MPAAEEIISNSCNYLSADKLLKQTKKHSLNLIALAIPKSGFLQFLCINTVDPVRLHLPVKLGERVKTFTMNLSLSRVLLKEF